MERVLRSQKTTSQHEMNENSETTCDLMERTETSDYNRATDEGRNEDINSQIHNENSIIQSRSHSSSDNTNHHLSQSMQAMENKVKSLESTLQTVTNQLTSAIRNLPSQSFRTNTNQNQMAPVPHNSQHSHMSRPRAETRPRSVSHSDTDDLEHDSNNYTGDHFYRPRSKPKLPPFTGRESWKVWFNRFEEVANRQRWSSEEKLDELLPRLQGVAGDFVFGQLNQAIRSNYQLLCKELNHRFRVVETTKSFRIQFSNRNQKSGETPEEYAAELKMLYDKAHTHRDSITRKDDLLRRFLDGLTDEKTRFYVEFVKEPTDIDEAVYQVVCFQETKSRSKDHNPMYSRQLRDEHSSSDNENDESIVRSVPLKNKHRLIQKSADQPTDSTPSNIDTKTPDLEQIRELIRKELQAVAQTQPLPSQNQYYRPHQNNRFNNPRNSFNNKRYENNRACFLCGDPSHFKRNCPQLNNASNNMAPSDQNRRPLNYNGLAVAANSQS